MIGSQEKTPYQAILDRAHKLPRSHQIALAASCSERALRGYTAPTEHMVAAETLVESIWASATEPAKARDRLRFDEAEVNDIADDLDRKGFPSWILQLFTLFEAAAELALGNIDIEQVIGPAQDIAYSSVFQQYLHEKGTTKEGFYASEDFFATARTYPVVRNELNYQVCLLDKFEVVRNLTALRAQAAECFDRYPVLWKIGY